MRFFVMFVTAVCVLLDICGGVGAEGWFPVPFDGPSTKVLLIAWDGMFGKKNKQQTKTNNIFLLEK